LPLALELAAARVRALSPRALNARLATHGFALLAAGSRDAPARHHTLRAAIDWSHELLEPAQRAVFRRLAVFAGASALEAAEAVCAPGGGRAVDVFEGLAALVEQSLLRQEEQPDGEPRYRMLETVREYALARLEASGEATELRRRHAEYYLEFVERGAAALTGPDQATWSGRLEAARDDLRAALRWLIEAKDPEGALRLGGALGRFWQLHGYLTEGRERLTDLLTQPFASHRTAARAKVLYAAGVLAHLQGDYAAAADQLEESLAISLEHGDKPGVATALNTLGNVAQQRGDYAAARARFEESLRLRREVGDRQGAAGTLANLGNVALYEGNYGAAQALYEESLAAQTALGDKRGVAVLLNNLGLLATERGDYAAAQVRFEESLRLRREVGDRQGAADGLNNLGLLATERGDYAAAQVRFEESLRLREDVGGRQGIAWSLEGLAALAAAQGQPTRALRLAGATAALREAIGAVIPPFLQARRERWLESARQELGEDAHAAAWAEGGAMTLEQAVAYSLGPTSFVPSAASAPPLPPPPASAETVRGSPPV
jgi:tetratricopeptide (TPR) repeat protein